MQEVVQRVLQGSVAASRHVVKMGIETLQNTEYTIYDDDMMKLFDILDGFQGSNDPRVFAIGRLVACSKDLSLRFLSLTPHKINDASVVVFYCILDIHTDESDIMHKLTEMIKHELQSDNIDEAVFLIIARIPDFVLENFDFLFELARDALHYEDVWKIFRICNLKNAPDELFLKVCEIYASDKEDHMEEIAFEFLERSYQHRKRPIHYGTIEKLMEFDSIDIVSVSAEDLCTLMQKYPSRIELLDIKKPSISGNEKGFKHFIRFIKNHFNTNTMEQICEFLSGVEYIVPFVHLLLRHLDDHNVQSCLFIKCKTLGPYLPIVVDFFLKDMSDLSLEFLLKVYKKCDNKEEIKEKVLILVENRSYLHYDTVKKFLDMLDGDLPIMNRKVYEKCIHAILNNPGLVQYLSPKYTEIIIKEFFKNDLALRLIHICEFQNVRELDQLILILIMRSNCHFLHERFWDFANALNTDYAIETAYIYMDFNFPGIEYAFLEQWKKVPYNYVEPRFITDYFSGTKLPSGKLLASLYNNTACKIHIKLINKVFNFNFTNYGKHIPPSFTHELSQLVLNLNTIDHKEELRTILVRSVQANSKELYNKYMVIRALERLGGDECRQLALDWHNI